MTGIIGAMDVEVEELKKAVSSPVKTVLGGIEFVSGKINGSAVCIARCNPGKVNAALCTQLMIDKYSPDCVINLGIGCSLSDSVKIKDVVIATDVCQYDIDTTGCGDPLGFISGLGVIKISADSALSDALERAALKTGVRVHRNTIASGDTFISSKEVKESVARNFGAVCGEMEGGAVGQVCFANGVPFAVLRSVSDGGDEASAIDYPTFKTIAAAASTKAIFEFLKA
ncbi:MAG: 5'-methylthioadenosine/adenosylhomocysteine nucleosidase [Eubacterium sp.]|nr:5'-methylthioadenosine/adenosylhomocysteine nucleosidase [Eubacterium sp.]